MSKSESIVSRPTSGRFSAPASRVRFVSRRMGDTREVQVACMTRLAQELLIKVEGKPGERIEPSRRMVLCESAIQFCDRALAVSGEASSAGIVPRIRAKALVHFGRASGACQLYEGAEAALVEAADFYASASLGFEEGEVHYYLGLTRDRLSKKEKAAQNLMLADMRLDRARQSGEKEYKRDTHIKLLLKLSEMDFELGELEQSLSAFVRALDLKYPNAILNEKSFEKEFEPLLDKIRSAFVSRDGNEVAFIRVWFDACNAAAAPVIPNIEELFLNVDLLPKEFQGQVREIKGVQFVSQGRYAEAMIQFELAKKAYRSVGLDRDQVIDAHIQDAATRIASGSPDRAES